MTTAMRTAIKDLRGDLRVAVDLREDAFTRRLDAEFVARGGRIVYAVDSAIMNILFRSLAPSEADMATIRSDMEGKGFDHIAAADFQLFKGPSTDLKRRETLLDRQRRVGHRLLWFLLHGNAAPGAQEFSKLLLLPGHVGEARTLFDSIVRQMAGQAARYSAFSEAAKTLKALAEPGRAGETVDLTKQDKVLRQVSKLFNELNEPHARFARYTELLKQKKILSLTAATNDRAFHDRRLFKNGGHVFLVDDQQHRLMDADPNYDGSISWWNIELHKRLPKRYVPSDRSALSTLDRLNRTLDPEEVRVILFTTNKEIIRAGGEYRPFKDRRPQESGGEYADLSFAELYLRHPRSLLVDGAFLRPGTADVDAKSGGQVVDGWLAALLDATLERPMSDGREPSIEADQLPAKAARLAFRRTVAATRQKIDEETRLARAIRSNRQLHMRFATNWADYLQDLVEEHDLNTSLAESETRLILRSEDVLSNEAINKLIAVLKARIRRRTEESWSNFFNTAADIGLELMGLPDAPERSVIWPVPPLYVEGNPTLIEPIEMFWDPARLRRDPNEIKRRLDDPKLKVSLQSTYVHTLCYGLLFAHAERWPLAKLLAQRALQIVKGLGVKTVPAPPNRTGVHVDGREAYFLLAAASRITARTWSDLEAAGAALTQASGIAIDAADGDAGRRTPLSGLRFAAEKLAIDVAKTVTPGLDVPEGYEPFSAFELRKRALSAIEDSQRCGVDRVRVLTNITLRSEYFHTLLLERVGGKRRAGAEVYEWEVERLVGDQLNDIAETYEDLRWLPLRDRALLRLGAARAGLSDKLPIPFRQSTLTDMDRHDETQGANNWDRKRLVLIEDAVELLKRGRAG